MPEKKKRVYKNTDVKRKHQRNWKANRRAVFMADKKCLECGSKERLEIHHRVPAEKVASDVWSWRKDRQEDELAKCDVLCSNCHKAVHKKMKVEAAQESVV